MIQIFDFKKGEKKKERKEEKNDAVHPGLILRIKRRKGKGNKERNAVPRALGCSLLQMHIQFKRKAWEAS